MEDLIELEGSFQANLSVAQKELENLSVANIEERLPVALFCLKESRVLGMSLSAQLMSALDDLKKEVGDLEVSSSALKNKLKDIPLLEKELLNLKADLQITKDTIEENGKNFKVKDQDLQRLNNELSKLRALPATLANLKKDIEKEVNRSEREKKKNKELKEANNLLKTKVSELKKNTSKSKEPLEVEASGKVGRYYIAVIEHPLKFETESKERIDRITDLRWHLRILSSGGIAVYPSISEWLTPILPYCTEFARDWTPEVKEAVNKVIFERAMNGHEDLTDRVLRTKTVKISKKILSEHEVRWLKAANMKDLYTALSMSYSSFTLAIRKNNVVDDVALLDLHKKLKQLIPVA